jgi:hypothetical protein
MSPHRLKKDRRAQILKAIKKISEETQSAFPSTPYFPIIGNNDLPDDYGAPDEDDTCYSDFLNVWQDAILCKHCNGKHQTTTLKELRKTFLYGGYYSVSIAGSLVACFQGSSYRSVACSVVRAYPHIRVLRLVACFGGTKINNISYMTSRKFS